MNRHRILEIVIDVTMLAIIASVTVAVLWNSFDRTERETLDRINRQREANDATGH